MPNQTIDLSRDCEAWYDFDTDYFDSNRGVIQDRSGHGRHAKASGGPTVGVEGPDSFEAASFDGSDDEMKNSSISIPPSNSSSLFILLNSETSTSYKRIWSSNLVSGPAEDKFLLKDRGDKGVGDAGFRVLSTGWNAIIINAYDSSGIDKTVVHTHGDEETFVKTIPDNIYNNGGPVRIASYSGGEYWPGQIASIRAWSRTLSDAEIEYLNRLTAPRRSQL